MVWLQFLPFSVLLLLYSDSSGLLRLIMVISKCGVLLIIGSGISLICMFFSPYSFMTLLYWPLLLAGGITALARRASLQKIGEYPS